MEASGALEAKSQMSHDVTSSTFSWFPAQLKEKEDRLYVLMGRALTSHCKEIFILGSEESSGHLCKPFTTASHHNSNKNQIFTMVYNSRHHLPPFLILYRSFFPLIIALLYAIQTSPPCYNLHLKCFLLISWLLLVIQVSVKYH